MNASFRRGEMRFRARGGAEGKKLEVGSVGSAGRPPLRRGLCGPRRLLIEPHLARHFLFSLSGMAFLAEELQWTRSEG